MRKGCRSFDVSPPPIPTICSDRWTSLGASTVSQAVRTDLIGSGARRRLGHPRTATGGRQAQPRKDRLAGLDPGDADVLPLTRQLVVSAFAPVDRLRFGHPASCSGHLQDAERYRGSAHVLPTPRCRGNMLAHADRQRRKFRSSSWPRNTASPIPCSSIQASVDIGP